MGSEFADLLDANRTYADREHVAGLAGVAARGVAVVTCMDARVDPLRMLGLGAGDAKVLRNAGGRVTPDVTDALVLAANLLGVRRILVVPHTKCAMSSRSEQEFRDAVSEASGRDASWTCWAVVADQESALRDDVARLRAHPLLPADVVVGGFRYDVDTGLLTQVD